MPPVTFSPDAPYPLIFTSLSRGNTYDFHDHTTLTEWLSTDLALTHNVLLRALNSLWLNAPLVLVPSDVGAFSGYALAFTTFLRAHHALQENVLFPWLQERGLDMRGNVVQHLAFEAPLREMEVYVKSVHERKEMYSSEKLLELRANLGSDLVQHLHDEVETVLPECLSQVSKKELKELGHAIEEHKHNFKDSTTIIPFMTTHHDKEQAVHWPVISSSAKWLGTHVGFHVHRDYWKFSPYSSSGELQTYPPTHRDRIE